MSRRGPGQERLWGPVLHRRGGLGHSRDRDESTAPKKIVVGQALRKIVEVGGLGDVDKMLAVSCRKQPRLADWDVTRLSTALKADDPDVSSVWSPDFCCART